MKKFFATLFAMFCLFAVCLTASSCSCSQIIKEREKREEQLLAVEGKGGHYYVNAEGIVKDNKIVYFSDLITAKVKADGKINLPKTNGTRWDVEARIHYDTVCFTLRYAVSEDDKEADVLVGYIDIKTEEVTYLNTHISVFEDYGVYLWPIGANDNYFLFQRGREISKKDVYYALNRKTNEWTEKITDKSPYLDGTEGDAKFVYANGVKYEISYEGTNDDCQNLLKYGEETLKIDYAYVLARSEKMQEIDKIVGQYKRSVVENLITYGDRLYVVISSESGMFGRGELEPVIFEYTIVTDSFEYIGCTELFSWYDPIFGVVPAA